MHEVSEDWQVVPPGFAVIVYCRTVELSIVGGWNDTAADPLPATATKPVGG